MPNDDAIKSRTAEFWLERFCTKANDGNWIVSLNTMQRLIITTRRDALDDAIEVVRHNSIPRIGGDAAVHRQREIAIEAVQKTFSELLALRDNPPKERGEG